MTSTIGYTRVPFCSIAPVQRVHNHQVVSNNHKSGYHRIFSREAVQSNGIIELIKDKKSMMISNSSKIIINTNNNRQEQQESIYLCIDMKEEEGYFDCSFTTKSRDIQSLIDSITQIAYKRSIKFVNIIELLKQLQRYQDQYSFVTCFDKQHQRILIYFPSNLSRNNTNQIRLWLNSIGIDINSHKDWSLSSAKNNLEHVDKNYFNDIFNFINQVDTLIESNELFSHKHSSS
ncbi:uncharacterized protein BX663DRAFT_484737 [Cokeromyces recurvatus]|uniref:uncharacterized protein n=1 Tax=Cokeromyces recurvatus TaxID=90255 RepID=UPI00221F0C1D|nr:uncharacterized protein BX663DRAFT_484737 [Cokeromyces recurvatus]KAI7904620.1 hypothetical protein BX663DRAFT_484737 [Cokeromyces recurvatus]